MSLHHPPRTLSEKGFGDFMRVTDTGERVTLDGLIKTKIPVRPSSGKTKEELITSIRGYFQED